jgi:hypothetical protein
MVHKHVFAAFLLDEDDDEEDVDVLDSERWNADSPSSDTMGRLSQSTPPRDSTL